MYHSCDHCALLGGNFGKKWVWNGSSLGPGFLEPVLRLEQGIHKSSRRNQNSIQFNLHQINWILEALTHRPPDRYWENFHHYMSQRNVGHVINGAKIERSSFLKISSSFDKMCLIVINVLLSFFFVGKCPFFCPFRMDFLPIERNRGHVHQ